MPECINCGMETPHPTTVVDQNSGRQSGPYCETCGVEKRNAMAALYRRQKSSTDFDVGKLDNDYW